MRETSEKFHAKVSYLNTRHLNMSFSFEQEINGKLSFLDVEISRQQSKFVTTVYRKPTYFHSFLPPVYQVGMIYILA